MLHIIVFLKELQTRFAVDFLHIVTELVATAEDFVKLAVAESDDAVVFNRTAVVNLVQVSSYSLSTSIFIALLEIL